MSPERTRNCYYAVAGLIFMLLTMMVPPGFIRGSLWGVGVGLSVPNWVSVLTRIFYPPSTTEGS